MCSVLNKVNLIALCLQTQVIMDNLLLIESHYRKTGRWGSGLVLLGGWEAVCELLSAGMTGATAAKPAGGDWHSLAAQPLAACLPACC